MPLVVILLIGISAFGLFDLTLGRPLPVAVPPHIEKNPSYISPDSPVPLSLREVAASRVEACDVQDAACQLIALYRFVGETVRLEPRENPWLHPQQTPARTLEKRRGDAADIAILFASLLDQRHIRNYIILSSDRSYILACDVSPSALRHAGGTWSPATPAFDPDQIAAANDPTTVHPIERIDAYGLQVGDAPCPCLLLDPAASALQQPGDPLLPPSEAFRSAIDLKGKRHPLVLSAL